MAGEPDVSVIIPAYKSARTIGRAIDSVLAQTTPAAEILVIDDGSPDDVAAAVAPYGDRVRCHRQQNAGASAARNAGVEMALGRFIAFLDADDDWEPHKLSTQLKKLSDNPKVGLIASRYYTEIPGQPRRPPEPEDARWLDRPVEPRGKAAFEMAAKIWTCTVLIRREALGDHRFVSGLEPAEDRDLWVRLITERPAILLSEPLATAVLTAGSMSRSDVDFGYSPMIQVLRRHEHLCDDPAAFRQLEASVYRGWASAHLAKGDARRALSPAWNRLKRQPASAEAWWVLGKSATLAAMGKPPKPAETSKQIVKS